MGMHMCGSADDKVPEPMRSTLRALREMGYAVSGWNVDIERSVYHFGGDIGAIDTGLVEFTITIGAHRAVPRPDLNRLPPATDEEFGDDFTGDAIADATPPRHPPPGWLPGDDDTWWHDR